MQKEKTIKRRVCTLLLLVAIVLELFLGVFGIRASAANDRGSDVLADLKQASNFHTDTYPVKNGSAELEVIQIAETTDDEILVYVYQPNETPKKYIATSINISATTDDTLSVKNYELDLLDYDGVFQKYLIKGLSVLSGTKRSYEVISIFRKYDENVDTVIAPDNGNHITEVVYTVAKEYTFTDTPEGYDISVKDVETIRVEDMFVGFLRYPEGFKLWDDSIGQIDSHFLAFTTNYHMDELLEADVCYKEQSYYERTGDLAKDPTYGTVSENQYAYLKSGVDWVYDGGWFSPDYKWKQIATSSEFVTELEGGSIYSQGLFSQITFSHVLTDEEKQTLESFPWVLRFVNTEHSVYHHSSSQLTYTETNSTIVSDVSILRLKFKTGDKVYDLPVISNKQTGSTTPVGTGTYERELTDLGELIVTILGIILLVILFIAFSGPITAVLKIIGTGLSFLLNILLFIVKAPFKIIGHLTGKRQKRR